MYYFEEEIAKATKAAGLRGVLGQTVIEFPVPDAKTPADALARAKRSSSEFAKRRADHAGGRAALGLHARRRDADAAPAIWRASTSVPLLIHLAETEDEIKTVARAAQARPVALLDKLGCWKAHVIAAHGVWIDADEIAVLKQRDVGVSHNPESNMKLASGTAPVLDYLKAGVARRPRHRRRGQQQRPRHVRGDAAGGVPAQAGVAAIRGR